MRKSIAWSESDFVAYIAQSKMYGNTALGKDVLDQLSVVGTPGQYTVDGPEPILSQVKSHFLQKFFDESGKRVYPTKEN
jgi:hypothetical protein